MDIGAAANSSMSQMLVLQVFTQNLIAGKPRLHSCSFSLYSGMICLLSNARSFDSIMVFLFIMNGFDRLCDKLDLGQLVECSCYLLTFLR